MYFTDILSGEALSLFKDLQEEVKTLKTAIEELQKCKCELEPLNNHLIVTTPIISTTPAAPKKNCFEIYQAGLSLPGTYTLDLDTKVEAYCLPGGWTVIQSRGQFGNAADYFLKPWVDYEIGFGTPGK